MRVEGTSGPHLYQGTGEKQVLLDESFMMKNKIFTIHDIAEHFGVSISRFRDRNPHLPEDFVPKARNNHKVYSAVVPQERTKLEKATNLVGQGPDSLEKRVRNALGKKFEDWKPIDKENFAVFFGDITNDTKVPIPMKLAAGQLVKHAGRLSLPMQGAIGILSDQAPTQLKNIYQTMGARELGKDVNTIRDFIHQQGGQTDLGSLDRYLSDVFASDSERMAASMSAYMATFGTSAITDLPQDKPQGLRA